MRMFTSAAFVLLMLSPAFATELRAATPATGPYFRLCLGYSSWSQDDMNSALPRVGQALETEDDGTYHKWEDFTGAPRLDGELGYRLSDLISIGFDGGFETSKRRLSGDMMSGSVTYMDDWRLTLFDGTVNATLYLPLAAGAATSGPRAGGESALFGGVEAGFCLGMASENDEVASAIQSAKITSLWASVGPVVGIFCGGQLDTGNGLQLFCRVGYSMRTMGDLTGSLKTPTGRSLDGSLDDYIGRSIQLNFGGPYVRAGLSHSFRV